jgi:GTPase
MIQGNDEAQYLIGVEDDGKQLGLSDIDLKVLYIYEIFTYGKTTSNLHAS